MAKYFLVDAAHESIDNPLLQNNSVRNASIKDKNMAETFIT